MKRSIKLLAFVATLLSITGSSFARDGGSLVGNGAGLAETEITYAYSVLLPKIIRNCLAVRGCGLDRDEEKTLLMIQSLLIAEGSVEDRITFLSEKNLPGFFSTGKDEHHRIAKTDSRRHAIIFINRDALYDAFGRATVDAPRAAGILVHELGHQIGIADHTRLDALGGKIRHLLSGTKIEVKHPLKDLKMTVYTNAPTYGFIIDNKISAVDIGYRVSAALECPLTTSPTVTEILNPYWAPTRRVVPYQVTMYLRYNCSNRVLPSISDYVVEVTVNLPIDAASGKTELFAESVGLTILRAN